MSIVLGQVIAENSSDFEVLKASLSKYPIKVLSNKPEAFTMPTQIIGWSFVKKYYPDQNIYDKKVGENISWGFSMEEDKDKALEDVDNFATSVINDWLPKDFKIYDPFFNSSSLVDFLEEELNLDMKTYVYFSSQALYICNNNNNFVVNLVNLNDSFSATKSHLTDLFNTYGFIPFSYKNIRGYVNFDDLGETRSVENVFWIKFGQEITEESFFGFKFFG